jgi:hypothetical protein
MIIRRNEKIFTKKINEFHKAQIKKITYWFLFIPVYSKEIILAQN